MEQGYNVWNVSADHWTLHSYEHATKMSGKVQNISRPEKLTLDQAEELLKYCLISGHSYEMRPVPNICEHDCCRKV
jgi:hypothetical protein